MKYGRSKNKLEKILGNGLGNLMLFLLIVIACILSISVGLMFIDLIFQTSFSNLLNINLVFLVICGLSSLLIILFLFIKLLVYYLVNSIEKQKCYLRKTFTYTENIDEIVLKLNGLYRLVKVANNIIHYNKFFMLKSEQIQMQRYLVDRISFIVRFITNLQSDFIHRINEQQKSLQLAKNEVEINIHGTPELSQVSDLQKARLDSQIEQFEELQKVLVKM